MADFCDNTSGGLCWSPRDKKLWTPSGLEGSSGSSGFERRGVAGAGHLFSTGTADSV